MKKIFSIFIITALLISGIIFPPPWKFIPKAEAITLPPVAPIVSAPYTCSTDYYVSTGGNDSNNGTSIGTPWLTYGHSLSAIKAISSSQPGTCLHFAAGTYNESMSDSSFTGLGGTGSGTTGQFALVSTVRHGAVLQIPLTDITNFKANFGFNNAAYVTIDGFDLEGVAGIAFTVTAANATQGAVYQDSVNGTQFTVVSTIASGTTLYTNNETGLPSTSGTLNKISGTGDSSITFSTRAGANDTGVYTNGGNNQFHHLTVINCISKNHGGAGIQANHMDYLTVEGNDISGNANNNPAEVSGVSDYQPIAFDAVAGSHNIIQWNIFHDNREIAVPGHAAHTDGNNIIMDDFRNSQNKCVGVTLNITASGGAITGATIASGGSGCITGNVLIVTQAGGVNGQLIVASTSSGAAATLNASPYTAGTGYTTASALPTTSAYLYNTLIQNNLTYHAGGGCIHVFESDNVSVINNTAWSCYEDTLINATFRGNMDVNTGKNNTFANNVSYAVVGAGVLANNTAYLDNSGGTNNTGEQWYNNLSYNGTPGQVSINFGNTDASFTSSSPNFNYRGVNPTFNNLSLFDFTLSSSFPSADGGTAMFGIPATDLVGNTVNPSAITIGAYQYGTPSTPGQVGTTLY